MLEIITVLGEILEKKQQQQKTTKTKDFTLNISGSSRVNMTVYISIYKV